MSPAQEFPTATGDGTLPSRPGAGFTRRLLRRPVAVVALLYLVVVIGAAIVGPIALPGVNRQFAGNLLQINQGPSAAHLLGTDNDGRDVLTRLIVGSRVTMVGVAEAVAITIVLAIPFGLAAGYVGGRMDRAVTWLADLAMSIPDILVIILVVALFPGSTFAAMATLAIVSVPGFMRVVRSAVLPVRNQLYIEAAEIAGLSGFYILTRHVLRRVAGTLIVQTSLLAAVALAVQSGLAFLGLLVAAPAPSWGGMVADGTSVMLIDPWLIWPPGVAIALTMLSLSLFGDAARDALAGQWSTARQAPARQPRRRPQDVRVADTVSEDSLLSVRGLSVSVADRGRAARIVEDVTFDVQRGEMVGLVGESGCGKTMTTRAILGLLPAGVVREAGHVVLDGADLTRLSERKLRRVRGKQIALVSQEPMVSLDPVFTVGSQLREALRWHLGSTRAEASQRALQLLADVHLPDPEDIVRRYPYELSGGMAQRVAIATALAGEPKLLIADEPTTALDVTVQAEILALLRELRERRGMAVLLVGHDWGVVADSCDRVVVMYAGEVVERADVFGIFERPIHPYTQALLATDPHHAGEGMRLPTIPGAVPSPGQWPRGCRFYPRCTYGTDECAADPVALVEPLPARETRCLHAEALIER
jgi:peptide/nickel transport system permease protein